MFQNFLFPCFYYTIFIIQILKYLFDENIKNVSKCRCNISFYKNFTKPDIFPTEFS